MSVRPRRGRRAMVALLAVSAVAYGTVSNGVAAPSPKPRGQVWSHDTAFPNGPSSLPLAVTDTSAHHTVVATSLQRASDGTRHTYVVDYSAAGKPLWRRTLSTADGQPIGVTVDPKSQQVTLLTVSNHSVQLIATSGNGRRLWLRQLPDIYRPSDSGLAVAALAVGGGGRMYVVGVTDYTPTEIYAVSRAGHLLWHRAYTDSGNGCEGLNVAGSYNDTVAVAVFCSGDAELLDFGPHGTLRWRVATASAAGHQYLAQALAIDPRTGNIALSATVTNETLTRSREITANYSPAGHHRWTRRLSTASADLPSGTKALIAAQLLIDPANHDIVTAAAAGSGDHSKPAECLATYTAAGHRRWTRCRRPTGLVTLDTKTGRIYLASAGRIGGPLIGLNSRGKTVWRSSFGASKPTSISADPVTHRVTVAGVDDGSAPDLVVAQYRN